MASSDDKIKEQMERALKTLRIKLGKVSTTPNRTQARELGDAIIAQMKLQISKGISPVQSAGRFPAYKTAAGIKPGKRGQKRKGYPFSVQDEYPGKKPRPVNLNLSGDMLRNLGAQIEPEVGGRFKLRIGYTDPKQAIKEIGHAEGANGQPKRPTIPDDQTGFNQTIRRLILKLLRQFVDDTLD